jgi:predicted DNA-binding transcriptional regulator AlpA
MDETALQTGLLLDLAKQQYATTETALTRLTDHTRNLDEILRDGLRRALTGELATLEVELDEAITALRAVHRAACWRALWIAPLFALIGAAAGLVRLEALGPSGIVGRDDDRRLSVHGPKCSPANPRKRPRNATRPTERARAGSSDLQTPVSVRGGPPMHNGALTRVTTEVAPLPALERTEAHRDTPTSPTRSHPSAQTARRAVLDFTPLQAMQLLRIDDVCRLLRISKPTFWRLRRRSDFPDPTSVTNRVIGCRQNDIEVWINRRRRSVR